MASVLRGISALHRGVTSHDRTARAEMCTRDRLSREDRTCPPHRGLYALHLVFLLQLSPKWGMNPKKTKALARRPGMPVLECFLAFYRLVVFLKILGKLFEIGYSLPAYCPNMLLR